MRGSEQKPAPRFRGNRYGLNGYRSAWDKVLGQGLTAAQLSLALVTGVAIGVLPVIWGTSVICFFLAWLLGLNHVVVQTTNYLVYPLQIALFLPFSLCGRALFPDRFSDSAPFSLTLMTSNWSQLDSAVIAIQLSALLGWMLTTPALSGVLYLCLFKICQSRSRQNSGSAER
jgi:uncharacterized protein (DUF2062 family)